jgi:predicted extracellular nuclease
MVVKSSVMIVLHAPISPHSSNKRRRLVVLLGLLLIGTAITVAWPAAAGVAAAQDGRRPIGVIQGDGDVSPFRGQRVSLRGVVTAIQEDINSRGVIYYTLFVQDLPGEEDGDPATADGIAVFYGRTQPAIPIGAIVTIVGEVTEFYGFTEIDDDDLRVTVERLDGSVPEAIVIDPPADPVEQRAYFEPLEGMRVTLDGPARVVGPTHTGCGLAVVDADDPAQPVVRRQLDDPTGRVIPVLYPTDVDCTDMPQVKTGDQIEGLAGVLIYNFDEFKILMEDPTALTITEAGVVPLEPLPALLDGQAVAATINANDWFDSEALSGNPDEPLLPPEVLAAKERKLAHAISTLLRCPTLVAVQEVEHAALLEGLAAALAPSCGFTYTVSHAESADPRGIDNALLSDPGRVSVARVTPQQVCSPVPTDHVDTTIVCDAGDSVLFDRPPLQVDMLIDGRPVVAFVNHFKSKREGEAETALERLAQARWQNALAVDLLAADPGRPVLVLGDLNDYEQSAPLLTLTDPARGGGLVSGLAGVPDDARYSYIFGGVAGLLDAILVSPALSETIQHAGVLHLNADYPVGWNDQTDPARLSYRFSDHDVPWIIWQHIAPPEPTPTPPSTVTTAPTIAPPTAVPTRVAPTTEVALVATPAAIALPAPVAPPTVAERPWWPWAAVLLGVVAVGGLLWLRTRR